MHASFFRASSQMPRSGRGYESVQDVGTRGLVQYLILLAASGIIVGCGPQNATPKTSHFEHDHDIAPHWPADLADAATKMRERLVWIESGRVPEMHSHDHGDDHHGDEGHHHDQQHDPTSEIIDLVAWVPEVAADTNLAESDWLPLYHASESAMTNLRAEKDELSRDDRSQVEALCQLIEEAVPKISEQLASLKVTSP